MGSRGIVGVRAVRESAEGGVDHLLGETSGVTLMLMSHTEDEFASTIGVLMMPGETAFARMPRAAYSMARDLVADGIADQGRRAVVDQAGGDAHANSNIPSVLR
jgi:hypothetical protein